MKAILSICVALIVVSSICEPNEAEALTVAVACYHNPLPPPGIPYENALCQSTWSDDGSVFTRGVKSSAAVQWWPASSSPVFVHAADTGIRWSPYDIPGPDQWVIICSDMYGSFRLYGNGYVYRQFAIAGGGFIWQQTATAGDAVFTYIHNPPSPTCTL